MIVTFPYHTDLELIHVGATKERWQYWYSTFMNINIKSRYTVFFTNMMIMIGEWHSLNMMLITIMEIWLIDMIDVLVNTFFIFLLEKEISLCLPAFSDVRLNYLDSNVSETGHLMVNNIVFRFSLYWSIISIANIINATFAIFFCRLKSPFSSGWPSTITIALTKFILGEDWILSICFRPVLNWRPATQ